MSMITSLQIGQNKIEIVNNIKKFTNNISYQVSGFKLTILQGSYTWKPNGFNENGERIFEKIIWDEDTTYDFSRSPLYEKGICGKGWRTKLSISPQFVTSYTKPSKVHRTMWFDLNTNLLKRYNDNNESGDYEHFEASTFPYMYLTDNRSKITKVEIITKLVIPLEDGNKWCGYIDE